MPIPDDPTTPRARGYVSSDDAITASALRNVTRDAPHAAPVLLVDLATGATTPIRAAMVSDDSGDLLLYIERP